MSNVTELPKKREVSRIPLGMRPGRRELNQASLRISVPEDVPHHLRARMREISHVYVEPGARRQRLATALMNFTCQEADANNFVLMLTAQPSDDQGPPVETLIKWYEQFGFKFLQLMPNGQLMARQPNERPQRRVQPVNQISKAAVRLELLKAQVLQ